MNHTLPHSKHPLQAPCKTTTLNPPYATNHAPAIKPEKEKIKSEETPSTNLKPTPCSPSYCTTSRHDATCHAHSLPPTTNHIVSHATHHIKHSSNAPTICNPVPGSNPTPHPWFPTDPCS